MRGVGLRAVGEKILGLTEPSADDRELAADERDLTADEWDRAADLRDVAGDWRKSGLEGCRDSRHHPARPMLQ